MFITLEELECLAICKKAGMRLMIEEMLVKVENGGAKFLRTYLLELKAIDIDPRKLIFSL